MADGARGAVLAALLVLAIGVTTWTAQAERTALEVPDGRAAAPIGSPPPLPAAGAQRPVRVVAVADIACSDPTPRPDRCRQADTAALTASLAPDAVLVAGDLQYDTGSAQEFARSYDPTWGGLKPITRPVPGNHEYDTWDAAAYFDYFGSASGSPETGWYSFDLGAWHLIALNSNCEHVSGCHQGSAQLAWLREDLARNADRCVLAYWHHPRWSNSRHGDSERSSAFVEELDRAGAELVLSGHDHNYQRFEPRRPDGNRDPAGLRQFVVGTGGKSLYSISSDRGLESGEDSTYGVLDLTLRPDGYDWRFLPVDGGRPGDRGSATCR